MSILRANQPCRKCTSSDAAQDYEDGWTHCFSCNANYRTNENEDPTGNRPQRKNKSTYSSKYTLEYINSLPSRGNKDRRLLKSVMEARDVKCEIAEDGSPARFFFPYKKQVNGKTEVVGYLAKNPKDKSDMFTVGDVSGIFGLNPADNSGGFKVILTEGEEDALAVGVANELYYGKDYPVYSLGSATGAHKRALAYREHLRKFDKIILWLDNDEPGQKAVAQIAKILGYDKVQVVFSDAKDANDKLLSVDMSKAGAANFLRGVWDSKPYSPASVIRGEDTWELYKQHKNVSYTPWPPFLGILNGLTYGRALSSITLFAAGTGIGKSSLLREDVYHILKTTDAKIGVCFLEESVGETVGGFISLAANKRIGLPTTESTEEEEYAAWQETLGSGRLLLIDHQGSLSDGSLIDKIEYLALQGCQYIYLDHITIAVVESEERDTNKAIDSFMGALLSLVKRHPVWIGVVSHLRKVGVGEESFEAGAQITEDDLKGSGSLKQISFQTIGLSRNKLAESEDTRHLTRLFLLKDRRTGASGPAGAYRFNTTTGRLEESVPKDESFSIQEGIETEL